MNYGVYTYREILGGEQTPVFECEIYVDVETPKSEDEARAAALAMQAAPLPVGRGPLAFMVAAVNPWPGSV